MSRTEPARTGEAGVTLIEMLVVLALIGTVAGAVGLGVGAASRGPGARQEADFLAARMRRASEEALLSGVPVALSWTEEGYRFLALEEGAWAPHPVPILGEARALPAGIAFVGEGASGGSFAVTAADLPASGAPLVLAVASEGGDRDRAVAIAWDGATATVTEP